MNEDPYVHFLHPRASASASCSLAAEVPVCRLEENKKKVEREGQTARHPPHPLPLRGTAGQGCSFARLRCSEPERSAGRSFGALSRSFGFSAARDRVLHVIQL